MTMHPGGEKQKVTLFGILVRAARAWMNHKRLAALAIFSLFVQQLFHTYFAYSLKLIIDNVINHANNPPVAQVLAGLAAAFALMAAASLGGEYINARACAYIFNDTRRQLYAHLQRLSSNFYANVPSGEVLSRFSGDLKALEAGYTQAFLNVILITLGLLINIPYMFYLDWRLALLTISLVPLLFIFVRRKLPRSLDAGFELRQREAETVGMVQETFRANQVIKTFALEPVMARRFEEKLAGLKETAIRSRFTIAFITKSSSMGVLFIQLCIVLAGAALAFENRISIGTFISFTTILSTVMKDVYEFAKKVIPSLVEAASGIQRIEEFQQTPVSVQDASGAKTMPRFENEIRFEGVNFSYTGSQVNLRDVNLNIRAGQSVVFVGSSGSGKSTILSLIMRFYDPQAGTVLFDGLDISQVTLKSLREQMSAVFQENYLFDTSIRENIRLGRPEASDIEVESAARLAEIHATIMSLPGGYDTLVGEAGGRLSGGQRQRIAIARAILSDPRILLLDEATSALDPATEDAINKTLEGIGRGRTVIAVTHRLNSAMTADVIFVMRHGTLVEQGTHAQLLARKGVYYELWQKQSGFAVSTDGRHARVDAERLRAISLFSRLEHDILAEIALKFHSEYFKAGQVVISQGDEGDKVYLIARGQVKVTARDAQGEERFIEFLEDGDHFGEMALLKNRPRNATIRATTPCVFLTMLRDDLLMLSENHPEIAGALAARMDISTRNLKALARGDF